MDIFKKVMYFQHTKSTNYFLPELFPIYSPYPLLNVFFLFKRIFK